MKDSDFNMLLLLGIGAGVIYFLMNKSTTATPTGTVSFGPTTVIPQSQADLDFGVNTSSGWDGS